MRLVVRGLATAVSVLLLPAALAAEAQPAGKAWRIGFVAPMSRPAGLYLLEGFRQGLRDRGPAATRR